jgi:hypothetical protein
MECDPNYKIKVGRDWNSIMEISQDRNCFTKYQIFTKHLKKLHDTDLLQHYAAGARVIAGVMQC